MIEEDPEECAQGAAVAGTVGAWLIIVFLALMIRTL